MEFITKNFYNGEKKKFIFYNQGLYEIVGEEQDAISLFKGKLVGSLPPLEITRKLFGSGAEHLKNSESKPLDEIIVAEDKVKKLFQNFPEPQKYNKLIAYNSDLHLYFITAKVIDIVDKGKDD